MHLQKDIAVLKKRILSLSAMVEASVRMSVQSLEQRDFKLATKVIESDFDIDKMEVEVEEDCLKAVALHQPVAIDLRFIVALLKINNDLERIGDLAVNIAERAAFLSTQPDILIPLDFQGMAVKAQEMLRKSLDAFVTMDAALAREVCASDDEVDAMNRDMHAQVRDAMRRNPENIEGLTHLLLASRHLERIADHSTNIAEDVIYMLEGEIVRHREEDFKAQARRQEPR